MRKIKEILKLNHENVSNREIARRLRIGAGSGSSPKFAVNSHLFSPSS